MKLGVLLPSTKYIKHGLQIGAVVGPLHTRTKWSRFQFDSYFLQVAQILPSKAFGLNMLIFKTPNGYARLTPVAR
jgi:hypothetical protein